MDGDLFRLSFKAPFHSALGLAVYNCGIQRCGPGHSWGPAVRDHYLIHCVTSGKGEFVTEGKRYALGPGDGFLVKPDQIIFYEADRKDPWEYRWVGFNGSDAVRLVSQTGLLTGDPVFSFHGNSMPDLLLEICTVSGDSPSSDARMQANLLLFLASLMDQNGASPSHPSGGYEYVQKALRFIEYNYSREITIQEVALSAGISRSHLYRLFMEHVSMPPNEYLLRYRISRAVSLLETNKFSVGEVAYSTGFSDQLYFSRVFKKYLGVPPSRYHTEHCIRKESHHGT